MPQLRYRSNTASSAMHLLQACVRPGPSSVTSPGLDFLLPRFAAAARRSFVFRPERRNTICKGRPGALPQPHRKSSRAGRALFGTSRQLSTTQSKQRTVPFYNPTATSAAVEMTPRAATRLAKIAQTDANPRLALRVQVESGGCHGFQYLMSLVTLPQDLASTDASPGKSPVKVDDTIFSYVDDSIPASSAQEKQDAQNGPKIILDGPSLDVLKGSKVDFTQELIGSQFKIVDNPLVTSSCGCGTSFAIDLG